MILLGGPAAIYHEFGSGRPFGFIRCQININISNIIRFTDASQRVLFTDFDEIFKNLLMIGEWYICYAVGN